MDKKLNFLVINVHGLFRGSNLELGKDSDTGGQTKYVYEYVKELGKNPDVGNVYVLTKLIQDKRYSTDYAQEIENISENVFIYRVKAGGKRYIKKEKLWKVMDEFIENALGVIIENDLQIDVVHSHYAEAGYVANELSKMLDLPFIHTGHSLGIPKKMRLQENDMTEQEINTAYNMQYRIMVEEEIIRDSKLIITSTQQEIDEQYGLYDYFNDGSYEVIPPGIDTEKFFPYYFLHDRSFADREEYQESMSVREHIRKELKRFFSNPEKPIILTICRPEKRKNIEGLIEAYAQDKELQMIANLAIFAGIRKDITKKNSQEGKVLTDMLLSMDRYDLYGKMAIPKKHDFEYEIPELYRYAAESGGVFVNSAYIEPFGLTLLEAGAVGLPIVSTDNGGPKDIVANCQNGILVDVSNTENIAKGIKEVLVDREKWTEFSNNAVKSIREVYSWEFHCVRLLEIIKEKNIVQEKKETKEKNNKFFKFKKLIITDIDNTLVGDDEELENFLSWYNANKHNVGLGVATGRNIESAKKILEEKNIPNPQIFITSVGTEIYQYNNGKLIKDNRWNVFLKENWQPEKIKELLKDFDFLTLQEDITNFKVSYIVEDYGYSKVKKIHAILKKNRLRYKLIPVEGKFIDILPYRASKYKAIAHVCNKWKIKKENILVAGDSGNDKDMIRKMTNGVVVFNHQKELKGMKNVYYSKKSFAGAILDGLKYYKFID
jgi:sucrose-phosphate synthase